MKKELWLRLRNYHFNDLVPSHMKDHVLAAFSGADASTQAFASKLARKLGWNRTFALHAIAEYKKFVFLGMVSDTPVTPPKIIDQVWHEHLLFSRGYRDFCRDVLGRDFDHHPELMPLEEQTETFQTQYVATLERYQEEFKVEAPVAFWGTPKFSVLDAKRKEARVRVIDRRSSRTDDDAPLWMAFSDSDLGSSAPVYSTMPEFGGGGGFSGAGGGASWGDSHGSSHGSSHDSHGSSHGSSHDSSSSSDSSSSDSSGGDSGGGDGGGSGCSSGCGGGGCGGS